MKITLKLEELYSFLRLILLINFILKEKKLKLLNNESSFGLLRLKLIIIKIK